MRRAWLPFAALAVTCRLLTPIGFMPGVLADGHVFVLCHSTTLGAMLHGSAGMPTEHMHAMGLVTADHDAPTPPDAHSDAWEHCPLGVTAHDIGPPSAVVQTFAFEPVPAPVPRTYTKPASVIVVHFRSRAPPVREHAIQLA